MTDLEILEKRGFDIERFTDESNNRVYFVTRNNQPFVIKQIEELVAQGEDDSYYFALDTSLLREVVGVTIPFFDTPLLVEFFHENNMFFFVLRQGDQFDDRIDYIQDEPEEATKMLVDISTQLVYLQSRGLAHCDIKPDNIVYLNGHYVLIDYGLSQIIKHVKDIDTTCCYTKYFASPEVLGHQTLDYRDEVWSLGMTIFQALAGPMEENPIDYKSNVRKIVHEGYLLDCEDIPNEISETLTDMLTTRDLRAEAQEVIFRLTDKVYQVVPPEVKQLKTSTFNWDARREAIDVMTRVIGLIHRSGKMGDLAHLASPLAIRYFDNYLANRLLTSNLFRGYKEIMNCCLSLAVTVLSYGSYYPKIYLRYFSVEKTNYPLLFDVFMVNHTDLNPITWMDDVKERLEEISLIGTVIMMREDSTNVDIEEVRDIALLILNGSGSLRSNQILNQTYTVKLLKSKYLIEALERD